MIEAHGALVMLVGWSLWIARSHIRETFRKAVSGIDDDGVPIRYRTAWIGFGMSGLIFAFWFMAAGLTPLATLLQTVGIFVALFGVTKYAA